MSCASFSPPCHKLGTAFWCVAWSTIGWIKLKGKVLVAPLPPLIVILSLPHLPQSRGHLIGQRSCHDHDISLSGTCSEHNTESVHVVTRCCHVHHLHGAAGQAKGHGPQRALRGWQSSDGSTKNTKRADVFTPDGTVPKITNKQNSLRWMIQDRWAHRDASLLPICVRVLMCLICYQGF